MHGIYAVHGLVLQNKFRSLCYIHHLESNTVNHSKRTFFCGNKSEPEIVFALEAKKRGPRGGVQLRMIY